MKEQNTVENIGPLFATAKEAGITVDISPHYYYPTDKGWQFEGALEKFMHNVKMFDRPNAYDLQGFEGSGIDFLPQYEKYIRDGKTIIVSPHTGLRSLGRRSCGTTPTGLLRSPAAPDRGRLPILGP